MKKAPTVMATTVANLKNQNLERGRGDGLTLTHSGEKKNLNMLEGHTVDLFVLNTFLYQT